MAKKSIFYSHPLFYIFLLKFLHRSAFSKRYQYMASFVKKGDTVLEPGCGPAILANFIPKESHYRGFDVNGAFIKYAAKKYPDVHLGNALNPRDYSPADVVVACDMLHHLQPSDRKTFIKLCFQSAKKVFLICEEGMNDKKRRDLKWLLEHFDQDGLNEMKIENILTKKFLKEEMENGFGVIPATTKREITEILEDSIVAYFK